MTQATSDKTPLLRKEDDIGPLREKTPKLNYTKRYDQVSWRSADTDFEVEPSVSSADELSKVQFDCSNKSTSRCLAFCTKRNRKLIALVIVVVIFLIIMAGLIYIYYAKTEDNKYVPTSPVVTACGEVSGITETITVDGKNVESYVFKGIPYGKPPIESLRWKPSEALTPETCWKGRYEASSFKSVCFQKKDQKHYGSEDCLYLNIFSPILSSSSNLPVFVWLHGGNLMTGSGNDFGHSPDSEFSHSMGVVSVSINYRLNAFGFLTLKELWSQNTSYGNFGFMDQILALKWIRENIKNFGGNKNDITICGEGSGGTSVTALLVSPLANGLFHKAITMSGSGRYETSYEEAASKQNQLFLNKTRCKNSFLPVQIKCLYNLTAQEIMDAIPDGYPSWYESDKFDFPTKGHQSAALAVIDPVVVPLPPTNLRNVPFKTKTRIPVIIGSTAQEIGIHPVYNFSENKLGDYRNYLKGRLQQFSPTFLDIILDELYVNITSNNTVEYLHESIASDVRLNCPLTNLWNNALLSDQHFLYRYVIQSSPSSNFYFGKKYAFRGWDVVALFDFKTIRKNGFEVDKQDLQFRDVLRENFQHFIKFGHMANNEWVIGKTAVINHGNKITVLERDYHTEKCLFWNNATNGFLPYAWIN